MNSLTLSRRLTFMLLGLGGLYTVGSLPVFADECNKVENVATLETCKDKEVTVKGPRVGMFDVPEYFMMADPNFTGGEGLQDYMAIEETQIILHTSEEVQCPEEIEVKGTLNQQVLGEEKAWVIKVKEFKCL